MIALAAQRSNDRQAIPLGQHAIHDENVVIPAFRKRQPVFTVGGMIGDVSRLAERLGEVIRRVSVVFDDEQSHVANLLEQGC